MTLVLATGCQSIHTRQDYVGIPARELDGLSLGGGTSRTTQEVIAMLNLSKACSRHRVPCADAILSTQGTVREGTRLVAASEVLYRSALQRGEASQALSRCVRYTHRYLFAPDVEGRGGPLSSRTQLALRAHNACTAGFIDSLGESPAGLHWQVDQSSFPVASVRRLVRSQRLQTTGLRTRQVQDGIGVAAVAFGRTERPQGPFPAQPFALPVSVRAEPTPSGDGIRLLVTDASGPQQVPTAFGPVDTARDISAAYASAAIEFENELSWWEGLRHPPPGQDVPRIRLLTPVDQTKTPVFLIHGLASSPMTWANLVNDLQGDPDIALHYQFWLVRYSTGLPLLRNRQLLAAAISEFHGAAFSNRSRGCRPAVAVGHSMGGVLARLLATDSGTVLWDAAFAVAPDTLRGAPADIADARDLFVFSRLKSIDELVLVASPHRGSKMAQGALSRVVRRLIRGPGKTINYLARLASTNPESVHPAVRETYLLGGPRSLDTLTPTQPVTVAGSRLPVSAGVRIHSIIGIKDSLHPEAGDGVVSLASASWPVGVTHRIHGDHGVHATPEASLIIKQILLDRMERNSESRLPGEVSHDVCDSLPGSS